ncbi:hypothetical protein BV22DRAFT_489731 [Leucogyrophana mollusca]|uniref:Uncharacterized protein n=1 Tax=Leucogyrophana mollusca TaxID=85980 RepID=A0ACB8BGZ4_9AGAM|nr:hypothetical protein BV22DRAFT_489731 [Leucogyrophana mollusca]
MLHLDSYARPNSDDGHKHPVRAANIGFQVSKTDDLFFRKRVFLCSSRWCRWLIGFRKAGALVSLRFMDTEPDSGSPSDRAIDLVASHRMVQFAQSRESMSFLPALSEHFLMPPTTSVLVSQSLVSSLTGKYSAVSSTSGSSSLSYYTYILVIFLFDVTPLGEASGHPS